jgi:hypothetical protein
MLLTHRKLLQSKAIAIKSSSAAGTPHRPGRSPAIGGPPAYVPGRRNPAQIRLS